MPIGISAYTSCNQLSVFASELSGLWTFVPLLGQVVKDADGNAVLNSDGSVKINRSAIAAVTGSVMIDNGDSAEQQRKDLCAWEFMRWYTGSEFQADYSNEIVSIMGIAARPATANRKALEDLPWTSEEKNNIGKQFESLVAVPNHPGSYYLARYVSFAFLAAYNEGKDPADALLSYVPTINKEINRKRSEFNLEVLDIGQTLASKRRDWIRGYSVAEGTGDITILEDENGNKYGIEALSDSAKSTYANELKAVTDALDAVPTYTAYCADEYINALRDAGTALKAATASASGADAEVFAKISEYINTCAKALKEYQASYPQK
jgi:hypothetical protein